MVFEGHIIALESRPDLSQGQCGISKTNLSSSEDELVLEKIVEAPAEPWAKTTAAPSTAPTPAHEYIATVILPAYNEAEALPAVLSSLNSVLDDRYEIIVVDDASTDDSAEIASGYYCKVLRNERNQGKGATVRNGLRAAQGRFVVIMDADNTYPAEAIPKMVRLSARYDFVRGMRVYESTAQMPLLNKIGNKLFDSMLKLLHGLEGNDHLTGLYGLHRETLAQMHLAANGFELEVEICIKAHALKLRSVSFPIRYGERLGEKKLHAFKDGWHILRRSFGMALQYHPVLRVIFRQNVDR